MSTIIHVDQVLTTTGILWAASLSCGHLFIIDFEPNVGQRCRCNTREMHRRQRRARRRR